MTYSEVIKGGWKTKLGILLYIGWILLAQFIDMGDLHDPVLLAIEVWFGIGVTHKGVKLIQVR